MQGVGFRPFAYKLANDFNLKGWINNGLDGIHIKFNSTDKIAQSFYQSILLKAPTNAHIYTHHFAQIKHENFSKLEIVASEKTGKPNMPITPDFSLCPPCRAELDSSSNQRYHYPFITCTYCGPRYSIVQLLPYDRQNTTMATFKMCPSCQKEYNNPLDRRYYSQTNSCETCGIKLQLVDLESTKKIHHQQSNQIAIKKVVNHLVDGKIIAVKGIGGYLLLCDAQNAEAIKMLRTRKNRPTKPFAVMYPSIDQLEELFEINKDEKEILTNAVASIVLLQQKKSAKQLLLTELIAPGLNRIGCMIPYAPLYQLIIDAFQRPLIATSANISGSPIIYEDQSAIEQLPPIADYILLHNRDILIPQDDSVLSFTAENNQKIIHRRSRGLAPNYENHGFSSTDKTVLAMGAQMKSSFSILIENRVYISQYLGDMDSYDTQQQFVHTLTHLQNLLACQPQAIITDKHPNYFTTAYGTEKGAQLGLPTYQVQHHKAHFMAVLAENKLQNYQEPILGVIWDGTGLGDDEQIWGGEFFVYDNKTITRSGHIGYFPFILGDKMPKEPRISALCVAHGAKRAEMHLKPKFTNQEWELYKKLLTHKNVSLATSSMGRLFDAVASILLNIDKTSYEGEAAIQLENLAKSYKTEIRYSLANSYFNRLKKLPSHHASYLINSILLDLSKGISRPKIAYYFHVSLVDLIGKVAEEKSIRNIAFSGGVFQNELLTDMMITLLQNEFNLYFHKKLSPNDENISFGQLATYMLLNENTN